MGFESTLWTVIRRARDGEEDALQRFVRSYGPAIVSYLVRRGFGREAEDLAQEVFLRVFRAGLLDSADPSKGRFRNLILAVTRNVLGNHVERQLAAKRGGGKVVPLEDAAVAPDGEDDSFAREWVTHLLARAFERLAREHPAYHEALRAFLLEGKTYAEIQARSGHPETTIKNHVHRGKRKLAEYVRDEVREYSASREDYEEELASLARFLPEGPN